MGAAFLTAVTAAVSAATSAVSGAFAAGGLFASGTLLGGIARTAIGIGLSLLARKLLAAPKPKPTETQQETKQPIPPRSFSYGRVKISGPLAFWEAQQVEFPIGGVHETLYKIVLLSSGEIDAIEQVYLNDKPVDIDPADDAVITAPYLIGNPEKRMVHLTIHLGTDEQAADDLMLEKWPSHWSSDHRLRGIAYIVAELAAPQDVSNFSKVYPQGEPQISALIRGRKVYDPRLDSTVPGGAGSHLFADHDTWAWSDNAALCVLDYLTHSDGYARPIAKIDLASFMSMADLCDEAVPLSAGGTERRYRVATTVFFTEQRKDVLDRLLEACDGRLFKTQDGLWGLRGGEWVEPTATLDEEQGQLIRIELREPSGYGERYNKLVIQFLSAPHGYVEQECDPWVNQGDIDAYGEVSVPLDLTQVPSYTQARRLAKIKMARDNPRWIATAQTNFAGLDCISQESVSLTYPDMLIDGPFWLETGPQPTEDFTGAQLQLRSADPDSYDWTTDEEGAAPAVPGDTSEDATLLLAGVGVYLIANESGEYMKAG